MPIQFLKSIKIYLLNFLVYSSVWIGAGAAAAYVAGVGRDEIHAHEGALNERLTKRRVGMEGLPLLGPPEAEGRGGIFSFNLAGLDSHEIAMNLDETANIAIRSGMQCVHSVKCNKNSTASSEVPMKLMLFSPASAFMSGVTLRLTSSVSSGSSLVEAS